MVARSYFVLFFLAWSLACLGESRVPTVEAEPIIVKAKRRELTPEEVDRVEQEIRPERSHHLSDTVAEIPSVCVRSQGGESSPAWISIRGQDPFQTRYFLESIPLTDSEFQRSPFHLLPTESYRQVNLYPSAPPGRFLSDGFGGAIEVRQGERDGKQKLSARVGSFNYARLYGKTELRRQELAFELSRSDEKFSYHDSQGTPFNSEDDNESIRTQNGFWRASLFPTITWNETSRSRTRSLGILSLGQTELPGSTFQPIRHSLRESFTLASVLDERSWEKSSLSSAIYYRRHEENLSGELPLSSWIPQRALSQAVGGKMSLAKTWGDFDSEVALGAEWDRYSPETTAAAVNHEKLTLPVSLLAGWRFLPSWRVQTTLFGQWSQYHADGDPRFFSGLVAPVLSDQELSFFSPRLAMVTRQQLLGGRFESQISGGYFQRGPSLSELYGSTWGMSPSTQLKEETAWKGEWETHFTSERAGPFRRFQIGYALHASRASDLIAYVQSSPDSFSSVNVGEALIIGHELQVKAELSSGVYGRGWGTLIDSTNLTDSLAVKNRRLPFRSHRIRFEVGVEKEAYRIGYLVEWIGRHATNLNNTIIIAPYTEHSLMASLSAREWGVFSFEARNLFDQKEVDAVMGVIPVRESANGMLGFPSPGRKIYLTWRYAI